MLSPPAGLCSASGTGNEGVAAADRRHRSRLLLHPGVRDYLLLLPHPQGARGRVSLLTTREGQATSHVPAQLLLQQLTPLRHWRSLLIIDVLH